MISTLYYLIVLAITLSGLSDRRSPDPVIEGCLECHSDLIDAKMKHPEVETSCEICHSSTGKPHPKKGIKGFNLAEKLPGLCYYCHEEKTDKKYIHYPLQQGDCSVCHSPHASNNSSLILDDFSENPCMDCHDFALTGNEIIHGPVGIGSCETCHDSHQSDLPGLITEEMPKLCFNCHEYELGELSDDNVHAVFETGCNICHDPHASGRGDLLTKPLPDLCSQCHTDIEQLIAESDHTHMPVMMDQSCATCHSAHSSSEDWLLKAAGKELCLGCHNKPIAKGKTTISDIGEILNNPKSIHGPFEEGPCSSCHNPHADDHVKLLTGEYPDKQYAESTVENFYFCFMCHDGNILKLEFTTTATNFREGDQNLHYLHIKGKRGRNCNLCHDAHASVNEQLIKEKVMFGNWEMPMKFKITENGGSCFPGCHGELGYNRGVQK